MFVLRDLLKTIGVGDEMGDMIYSTFIFQNTTFESINLGYKRVML